MASTPRGQDSLWPTLLKDLLVGCGIEASPTKPSIIENLDHDSIRALAHHLLAYVVMAYTVMASTTTLPVP